MKRWWPFCAWLLLVAGFIGYANSGFGSAFLLWLHQIPWGDKLGHFLLVGSLAFFLNHALRQRRVGILNWRVLLGGALVAVAITLEEISQIWIPHRQFDFGDLAANYAGIAFAGLIAVWPRLKPRVSNSSSPATDPL